MKIERKGPKRQGKTPKAARRLAKLLMASDREANKVGIVRRPAHSKAAAALAAEMKKRKRFDVDIPEIVRLAQDTASAHEALREGYSKDRDAEGHRLKRGHLQGHRKMSTSNVKDYMTGNPLPGRASAELTRQSRAEEPTGAVPAYRDERGMWQYVAPHDEEHYRRNLRVDVRTVYVDAAPVSPRKARKRASRRKVCTTAQLQALRQEAGQAGDSAQVSLCDRALAGGKKAMAKCCKAMALRRKTSPSSP